MKVKYVNANIKSVEEAVRRLMHGEIFYLIEETNENKKSMIFFDETLSYRFGIRYSIYLGDGDYGYDNIRMDVDFNNISDWKIERKIEWYDDIPKQGILCRVSDTKREEELKDYNNFAIIKYCDESNEWFTDDEGKTWNYAIPVLLNDNILLENNY